MGYLHWSKYSILVDAKLGFWYEPWQKGYDVDVHEKPATVEYRKQFVTRYLSYEQRAHCWINTHIGRGFKHRNHSTTYRTIWYLQNIGSSHTTIRTPNRSYTANDDRCYTVHNKCHRINTIQRRRQSVLRPASSSQISFPDANLTSIQNRLQ